MAKTRANWKGYLKIEDVVCPVSLYTAVTSSDHIKLHTINRKTGNRVNRIYVDSETGDVVDRDDQVKGYEVEDGKHIIFEPEEITDVIPDSDKTLKIQAFVPCSQIDTTYFDKPYFLAPSETGEDVYSLLWRGMEEAGVAAIAQTVIFRRLRTFLLRPRDNGFIATSLNFEYEVRDTQEAFSEVPDIKSDSELIELAQHIIVTKRGSYNPEANNDRYDEALTELVKAKIAGKKLPKHKEPVASKPSDLLQALRDSVGTRGKNAQKGTETSGKSKAASSKKSGKQSPETRKRAS
jgi:DNA end-binding protein Ku